MKIKKKGKRKREKTNKNRFEAFLNATSYIPERGCIKLTLQRRAFFVVSCLHICFGMM
jgi:hypothetical protein